MAKFRAYFTATATEMIEFEVDLDGIEDPDDRRDKIEDAAYEAYPSKSLCHQCARHLDLGDFEIADYDNDIVPA